MIQRQPANGVLLVVFILAIFFLNPIAIAQTHDLKFNLVSGPNGILLGKINSMTGKGEGGGHHLRKRQRPRIPEHIKEKIFQPFFTTKPTGEGTGLGLSLSYDIVKAHGGELRVETKENEGSEFIIQLRAN
jgi:hypothetical protein